MKYGAGINLQVRTGYHGEKVKTFELRLDESLARALMEPVELSNDMFSLSLLGRDNSALDSLSRRQKIFKMRKEFAIDIANELIEKLIEAFGQEDIKDGYTKEQFNNF